MIHVRFYKRRDGDLVGDVVFSSVVERHGGEIVGTPFRPESLPPAAWAEMIDSESGRVIGCGPVSPPITP